MRFLSLFSGIEAASVAWKPLGWTCVGVAEIDPFGCHALRTHYPNVPNLGDVSLVTEEQIAALGHIDVLVFGSPCQDLSVAGKRKGFDGERSSLFFIAMRIVQWARVHCGLRFAVWENVPGAFSSNDGADFAAVVGELAGLDAYPAVPPRGWGTEGAAVGPAGMVEWSTLDAQWFGVAQRRRRVFAVADFGNWAARPPVLLESESLRGDSAPRREAWEELAAAAEDGAGIGGGVGLRSVVGALRATDGGADLEHARAGQLVPCDDRGGLVLAAFPEPTAGTLCADKKGSGFTGQDAYQGKLVACASFNAEGSEGLPFLTASNLAKQFNNQQPLIVFGFNWRQDPDSWLDRAGPLACRDAQAIATAFCFKASHFTRDKDGAPSVVAPPLSADADKGDQDTLVFTGFKVRRLTPIECERLQGFADNYTRVATSGQFATDTPRYRALGNSMCVNVMRWIGRSIEFAYLY